MVRERCSVKISKHGNSYHVSLPASFRHALGLCVGESVNIELFREQRAIVIQPLLDVPRPVLPTSETAVAPRSSGL